MTVMTALCTGLRDEPHDRTIVDLVLTNGRGAFDCPRCGYDVHVTPDELAWLTDNLELHTVDLHHLAVTLHLYRRKASA